MDTQTRPPTLPPPAPGSDFDPDPVARLIDDECLRPVSAPLPPRRRFADAEFAAAVDRAIAQRGDPALRAAGLLAMTRSWAPEWTLQSLYALGLDEHLSADDARCLSRLPARRMKDKVSTTLVLIIAHNLCPAGSRVGPHILLDLVISGEAEGAVVHIAPDLKYECLARGGAKCLPAVGRSDIIHFRAFGERKLRFVSEHPKAHRTLRARAHCVRARLFEAPDEAFKSLRMAAQIDPSLSRAGMDIVRLIVRAIPRSPRSRAAAARLVVAAMLDAPRDWFPWGMFCVNLPLMRSEFPREHLINVLFQVCETPDAAPLVAPQELAMAEIVPELWSCRRHLLYDCHLVNQLFATLLLGMQRLADAAALGASDPMVWEFTLEAEWTALDSRAFAPPAQAWGVDDNYRDKGECESDLRNREVYEGVYLI